MGFWSVKPELFKKLPKWAGIGGAVAGVAVAAPMAYVAIRNGRRADPDDMPASKHLSDPLPQVMEYAPPAPPAMDAQAQQEEPQMIMGKPVVGDFSRSVLSKQAGLNVADRTNPNITGRDGRNTIDGSRNVEQLGSPVVPGR